MGMGQWNTCVHVVEHSFATGTNLLSHTRDILSINSGSYLDRCIYFGSESIVEEHSFELGVIFTEERWVTTINTTTAIRVTIHLMHIHSKVIMDHTNSNMGQGEVEEVFLEVC